MAAAPQQAMAATTACLYDDGVYGNDGWGGTTTTKAKEDGKGRSPMRQHTDNIADEIDSTTIRIRMTSCGSPSAWGQGIGT